MHTVRRARTAVSDSSKNVGYTSPHARTIAWRCLTPHTQHNTSTFFTTRHDNPRPHCCCQRLALCTLQQRLASVAQSSVVRSADNVTTCAAARVTGHKAKQGAGGAAPRTPAGPAASAQQGHTKNRRRAGNSPLPGMLPQHPCCRAAAAHAHKHAHRHTHAAALTPPCSQRTHARRHEHPHQRCDRWCHVKQPCAGRLARHVQQCACAQSAACAGAPHVLGCCWDEQNVPPTPLGTQYPPQHVGSGLGGLVVLEHDPPSAVQPGGRPASQGSRHGRMLWPQQLAALAAQAGWE
jgi:hypothetical protein